MTEWNQNSNVTVCHTCEGAGVVPSFRPATIDDPYPEVTCPDCDGEHSPKCEVCGFDQALLGYDCLACDTVAALFETELARLDLTAFAAALEVARGRALAEYKQEQTA